MSRIFFITSSFKIDFGNFNIPLITANDYLLNTFPYLKNKQYIYDFDNFNNKVSYKEFVKMLCQLSLKNDCCIELIVLWNTTQKSEISQCNIKPNYVIQINNDSNLYSLIYALENDSILPSTAYIIKFQ